VHKQDSQTSELFAPVRLLLRKFLSPFRRNRSLPASQPYGTNITPKEMALRAIEEALIEREFRGKAPPNATELRRKAENVFASSIENGSDDYLGTGIVPSKATCH
jgi:hypothetical protein